MKYLIPFLIFCLPLSASAVAFDQYNVGTSGTGTLSFLFTPVAVPRGIICGSIQIGTEADQENLPTYGGVTMKEVTGSPNILVGGEVDVIYMYFLGSGIPTGAQTVTMTVTGASNKLLDCTSLTANTDTEVVTSNAAINSTSQTNPSVTLSINNRPSFSLITFGSGQNGTAGITPFANWTSRSEFTSGTQSGGTYTYDIIGTTNITSGWTQSADDALAITLAVSEIIPHAQVTIPVGGACFISDGGRMSFY